MRNLQAYPITKAEIIGCLTRLADAEIDPAPGNMQSLLLQAAITIIVRQPFDTFDLDHLTD